MAVRISVSYMYEMEMVPTKRKKTMNLIGAITDSSSVIFIAIFYFFTRFGEGVYYIYIIFTIALLVVMFKIPETPSYLYSKKKWDELHSCFDTFAKINSGERLGVKFDKEDNEAEEETKTEGSLKSLF
mmetsp:Transcript_6709/g.5839  ORF Transcript_6709/g.5839 Transcript_6709/m.5839 type:complete len:128 (-) Transcript_6709:710-1093(-)